MCTQIHSSASTIILFVCYVLLFTSLCCPVCCRQQSITSLNLCCTIVKASEQFHWRLDALIVYSRRERQKKKKKNVMERARAQAQRVKMKCYQFSMFCVSLFAFVVEFTFLRDTMAMLNNGNNNEHLITTNKSIIGLTTLLFRICFIHSFKCQGKNEIHFNKNNERAELFYCS